MAAPRILVVGSANMDLVLEVERVPSPGENLIGTHYSYIPGGKGANQAVAAARAGARVALAGRVGSDAHGGTLLDGLKREGIDTQFVGRDEGPSGLAVILVDAAGQNRILVYPGANMTLRPEHLDRAFGEKWDAVMLQLEVPDDTVAGAVAKARARGIPVVLDAGPARAFDLGLVQGLDILSPNQSETTALTGLPCDTVAHAEAAARALADRSRARIVVIKMGALGAFAFTEGRGVHVPAFPIKAVDPTAAGDAFTAAMAVAWLKDRDVAAAVRVGNAAGALAASRLGAQPSLPSAGEIEGFLGAAR